MLNNLLRKPPREPGGNARQTNAEAQKYLARLLAHNSELKQLAATRATRRHFAARPSVARA